MKHILPLSLFLLTISSRLWAATYVTTSGLTLDITDVRGDPHYYSGTNLAPNADLSGAGLSMANLLDADLSGANLTDAQLNGLAISSVFIIKTNLVGANFTGANLTNTNLSYADLAGVTSGNITGTPTLPSDYQMLRGYIIGP